jgi:phosphohistidine phosphatase
MAPQLWLLRHGEAVPHDSKPDDERELTARGERQALAAGAALARLGLELSACYTSPKLRARQTAELACRALGTDAVEEESVGYGFDRDDAIALLRAHGDDARVLVVGHDPDFSQVVHDFTGGRVDFKKGGIAAVREASGSGELLVLLRPRELETIVLDET